jgi:DNA topoisomerase VI subunit B
LGGHEQVSTWRTPFTTDRAVEYFNQGGLRALIGQDLPLWALTLIKELTDNGLDACEAAGVAPEIAVTVGKDFFSIADNGSGLSPETITGSLNYDVRISDKKWYVGPTRGQLGSALKTLWPACAVATGKRSIVEVTACGVHHTITAYSGEIKSHEQKPATVKNGTFIKVHWPEIALLPDL